MDFRVLDEEDEKIQNQTETTFSVVEEEPITQSFQVIDEPQQSPQSLYYAKDFVQQPVLETPDIVPFNQDTGQIQFPSKYARPEPLVETFKGAYDDFIDIGAGVIKKAGLPFLDAAFSFARGIPGFFGSVAAFTKPFIGQSSVDEFGNIVPIDNNESFNVKYQKAKIESKEFSEWYEPSQEPYSEEGKKLLEGAMGTVKWASNRVADLVVDTLITPVSMDEHGTIAPFPEEYNKTLEQKIDEIQDDNTRFGLGVVHDMLSFGTEMAIVAKGMHNINGIIGDAYKLKVAKSDSIKKYGSDTEQLITAADDSLLQTKSDLVSAWKEAYRSGDEEAMARIKEIRDNVTYMTPGEIKVDTTYPLTIIDVENQNGLAMWAKKPDQFRSILNIAEADAEAINKMYGIDIAKENTYVRPLEVEQDLILYDKKTKALKKEKPGDTRSYLEIDEEIRNLEFEPSAEEFSKMKEKFWDKFLDEIEKYFPDATDRESVMEEALSSGLADTIREFEVANDRYPNPTELRDIAKSVGLVSDEVQPTGVLGVTKSRAQTEADRLAAISDIEYKPDGSFEFKTGMRFNVKEQALRMYEDLKNQNPQKTTVFEWFQNIIDAIREKEITEKGVPRTVRIEFKKLDNGNTQVVFEDSGLGMTPEIIKEKFFTISERGTKGGESSGSHGIGKTVFLGYPLKWKIESWAKHSTSSTGYRYTFVDGGGVEFLSGDMDVFTPKGYESHKAQGTGTRFTIEVLEKEDNRTTYNARLILDSINELSRETKFPLDIFVDNIQGERLLFKSKSVEELPGAHGVDDRIAYGNNNILVKFIENPVLEYWTGDSKNNFPVKWQVTNKGVPLNLDEYALEFNKLFKAPDFKVAIDFLKTPDNDKAADYPFFNNRTKLHNEIKKLIEEKVNKEIDKMVTKQHDEMSGEFNDALKKMPTVNGVKVFIPFSDKMSIDASVGIMKNNPDIVESFAKFTKSFNEALRAVGEKDAEFVLSPLPPEVDTWSKSVTLGFRPHSKFGIDIYAINPFGVEWAMDQFSEIYKQAIGLGADKSTILGAKLVDVYVHEYTHKNVPGHENAFSNAISDMGAVLYGEIHKRVGGDARAIFENYGERIRGINEAIVTIGKTGDKLSIFGKDRFGVGDTSTSFAKMGKKGAADIGKDREGTRSEVGGSGIEIKGTDSKAEVSKTRASKKQKAVEDVNTEAERKKLSQEETINLMREKLKELDKDGSKLFDEMSDEELMTFASDDALMRELEEQHKEVKAALKAKKEEGKPARVIKSVTLQDISKNAQDNGYSCSTEISGSGSIQITLTEKIVDARGEVRFSKNDLKFSSLMEVDEFLNLKLKGDDAVKYYEAKREAIKSAPGLVEIPDEIKRDIRPKEEEGGGGGIGDEFDEVLTKGQTTAATVPVFEKFIEKPAGSSVQSAVKKPKSTKTKKTASAEQPKSVEKTKGTERIEWKEPIREYSDVEIDWTEPLAGGSGEGAPPIGGGTLIFSPEFKEINRARYALNQYQVGKGSTRTGVGSSLLAPLRSSVQKIEARTGLPLWRMFEALQDGIRVEHIIMTPHAKQIIKSSKGMNRIEVERAYDLVETGGIDEMNWSYKQTMDYINRGAPKGVKERFEFLPEKTFNYAKEISKVLREAGLEYGIPLDRMLKDYAPRMRKDGIGMDAALKIWKQPELFKWWAEEQRTGYLMPHERNLTKVALAYVQRGARKKALGSALEEWARVTNKANEQGLLTPTEKVILDKVHSDARGFPALFDSAMDVTAEAFAVQLNKLISAVTMDKAPKRYDNPIYRRVGEKENATWIHEGNAPGYLEVNDVMSRLVNLHLNLTYAGALGFRPVAVIRNMTQMLMTTLPIVGGKHFVIGAKRAMTRKGMEEARAQGVLLDDYLPLAGELEKDVQNTLNKASQVALWAYTKTDNLNRAVSYHAMKSLVLEKGAEFKRMTDGKVVNVSEAKYFLDKFMDDSEITYFHSTLIKNEVLPFLAKGDLNGLAERMGKHLSDETQWVYRRANSPYWMKGRVGKIVGQFGTWPIWYIDFMRNLMTRGSKTQIAKRMVMWTAVNGGLREIGDKVFGVDLNKWVFWHPINWAGGIAISSIATAKDVAFGDDYTKAKAINNIKNIPGMYIPGYLAIQSLIKATEERKEEDAIKRGLGFTPAER